MYAGVPARMAAVDWRGKPAALLGLDLLRPPNWAASPGGELPTAAGGLRLGRLVLDFDQRRLVFACASWESEWCAHK